MDFLMPYLSEVPVPEIDHLETPSPLNPLGIKGAGEAGVIPVSACLAAAIEDAAGVPVDHMPISPPELWAKLGTAGAEAGAGADPAEASA
jgi:CO/xanthine dehydrogenase Mo-binding subunit